MKSKLGLIVIAVALVAGFWALGLEHYLTLDYLKSKQEVFNDYQQTHFAFTALVFVAVYVVATALSLPGAIVLTLAGGALFGFLWGTILVSIASTTGATCAFLASRFLFRDAVQNKFGTRLKNISDGIARDGAFYLFGLRLVPLFPFFVINLVMGLTPISTKTFFFVSQIGMLPGTAAYVNAGTQLSRISSLSQILSPTFVISFAVIGLLPLISKSVISHFRNKKVLGRFRRPARFDYNVVVIGAGSAGLVSAYIASALKAKVALIEKHKMGGDCLNTGCVPSKALIRSAKMLSYASRAKEFGFSENKVEFKFSEVMERIQRVIKTVEPHDSVERYSNLGVDCIQGNARIVSPYLVQVDGRTLSARSIIIATGARPLVPPIPGLDQVKYLTSDTVWDIRECPKRLLVLGGGPIGVELAQTFHRLGAAVTQVEAYDCILSREDTDVSDLICKRLSNEGINILTRHRAERVEVEDNKKFLVCSSPSGEVRVEFDEILLALGRKPNVTGFGLQELGVEVSKDGTIAHDSFLRTNFPNIYVCGDVAGPYQFTHTAAHQAWFASVNSLLSPFKSFRADYRVVPWCTFSDPEVARVGINEREAKAQNITYSVTRYEIDDLDRAIADSEAHGFVKVLTPPDSDKILGVSIVGPHAGDIISEYILAMKHGLGLNKILGTIHIYPTLAEANKYAAGVWRRAHSPAFALRLLEKFHLWRLG